MPKNSIIGGLSLEELNKVQRILGNCENLERAQIFGSRAMNTHKPSSDVDLALFGENLSRHDVNTLKIAFEDSTLPHTFDLILHYAIKEPELLAHIKRRGVDVLRKGFILARTGNGFLMGVGKTTLGAITDWASGGTPSKSNSSFWEGTIPWISATSMNEYIEDSQLKITSEAVDSGSRIAKQGTLLFLVRGSGLYNNISFGLTKRDVAFNQDVKSFTSKDSRVSHELLYYLLKGKLRELRFLLEDTGIGAGKFDSERLRNLKLAFPKVETERSELLATCKCLDVKIELLREQNETLEALAQTLFKRWFIDFNFPACMATPCAGKARL